MWISETGTPQLHWGWGDCLKWQWNSLSIWKSEQTLPSEWPGTWAFLIHVCTYPFPPGICLPVPAKHKYSYQCILGCISAVVFPRVSSFRSLHFDKLVQEHNLYHPGTVRKGTFCKSMLAASYGNFENRDTWQRCYMNNYPVRVFHLTLFESASFARKIPVFCATYTHLWKAGVPLFLDHSNMVHHRSAEHNVYHSQSPSSVQTTSDKSAGAVFLLIFSS